jgi:chromosome segregation ATPase
MINNIKNLAAVGKRLSQMNDRIEVYSDEVKGLKEEIKGVRSGISVLGNEIQELRKAQSDTIEGLGKEISEIRGAREHLRKSVYDFDILKRQLHKEIITKFEAELKKGLVKHTDSLIRCGDEYESVRSRVEGIVKEIGTLTDEMAKLRDISRKIKKEDFEMTGFADKIRSIEGEKLALLRKIDSLERLVSRMRRR